MRLIVVIITAVLVWLIPGRLVSQALLLSDWQTFSSMNTVRGVAVDPQFRLWCATSGGVFVHDPSDGTTREFRNINALSTLDATAIAADAATGMVYVGGFDGSIDVASPDLRWRSIRDIRRATQYQRRRINDLLVHDGMLYIATDFGIVTYDVERRLFMETIDRIGPLQEKTAVSSVCILHDSLWATTEGGVVVAPLRVTTLRQPSAWRLYDTSASIATTGNRLIRTNGSSIFVVNGNAVLRYNGSRFDTARSASSPILGLSFAGSVGYLSIESGTYTLGGVPTAPWPAPLLGHTSYQTATGEWELAGFVYGVGLARMDAKGQTQIVTVNSPTIAQFNHIRIDVAGNLWAASYNPLSKLGQGATMYDGATWRSFSSATTPSIASNNIYRISTLPDGRIIVGSWGRGAFAVTSDGDVPTTYDQRTTQLRGIEADSSFVLVGDVALDRTGTLWMVNEQAGDRMLVSVGKDGTSHRYQNCTDVRSNYFRPIAIDAAGNKWLGGPGGEGLLVYNERSTPDDVSDDLCNVVRASATNLPDNIVTSLAMDNNGALWIGTAKGIGVITTPTTVSRTAIPFVRRVSSLSAVQVNDVFVDALNYKWIATSAGVYVLNEDGTEVLATISASNSPLLSDNVRSIAVDDRTGRAWFGHLEGLSSVQTQSLAPRPTFALSCYPQPYRPSSGEPLVIDGLAPDADIRILTPAGAMVNAVQSRGRQALWDGLDTEGRTVPPGVYIVHVRSASSKEASVGKIVVTR